MSPRGFLCLLCLVCLGCSTGRQIAVQMLGHGGWAQIEIVDLNTAKPIKVPPADGFEWVVGVDQQSKTFSTFGYTRGNNYALRTLQANGEVIESRTAEYSPPLPEGPPSAMAWSDDGKSCVYYHKSSGCFRSHNFITGENKVLFENNLLPDVAYMVWLNSDEILLTIPHDSLVESPLQNCIARLTLSTGQIEKLCSTYPYWALIPPRCALSPDKTKLAFVKDFALYILDLEKDTEVLVVPEDDQVSDEHRLSVGYVSWAADGTGVLFTAASQGDRPARGRDPEEQQRLEIDRLTYSMECPNVVLYSTKLSVNVYNHADRSIRELAVLPEYMEFLSPALTLDKDRIVYAFVPQDLNGQPSREEYLVVYNTKDGREERRIERRGRRFLREIISGYGVLQPGK